MMISEELYDYCDRYSEPEKPYLAELRRQTHLRTRQPNMISGPVQGQILKLLVQLFKVSSVLEIGTFTGYATLCMAEGLLPGGLIHTIEIDEEMAWFHRQFFTKSGRNNKIKSYYGDANEIIPNMDLEFDFVFMDAGKKDYQKQLEMLLGKMRKGGVILADNVLWKGRVLASEENFDKKTRQIHDFNSFVCEDSRIENVILPIRDGLNLIVVK